MDLETILIGGVGLAFIIDKGIGYLKTRGIDIQELSNQIKELHAQTPSLNKVVDQSNDLWDWHNVSDAEGVKIWYVRKSLENNIANLALSIDKLSDVVASSHSTQQSMIQKEESMLKGLQRIEDKINV